MLGLAEAEYTPSRAIACRLLQAELQALHETLGGIIAGLGVYIEGPECPSQVKVKMYKETKIQGRG